MLINWFTVGAQLVNFGVLVWLMKRFLYQPILRAIDTRERRIATQAADLAQQTIELQKVREALKSRTEEFDRERGALLAKATTEATSQRERLLSDAHHDADAIRIQQQAATQQDAVALSDTMTHLATAEIFDVVRKTLRDLANADLEERVGAVFTRRLRALDARTKEALGAALGHLDGTAIVRSYFQLPDGERATIQNAINETFSADIPLRFETAPETICGIELTAGGQKLAWTIEEYLRLLQEKVVALPLARST